MTRNIQKYILGYWGIIPGCLRDYWLVCTQVPLVEFRNPSGARTTPRILTLEAYIKTVNDKFGHRNYI